MHYVSQLYFNKDDSGRLTDDYAALTDPKAWYQGYDVLIISSSYADHLETQEKAFEAVFGYRKVSWDVIEGVPPAQGMITKFTTVARRQDITARNLADLGMYLAKGTIAVKNMPKGKISVKDALNMLEQGYSLAFSCGSHRTDRDFLYYLEKYYGKTIYETRFTDEFSRKKVQREAPDLIQPLLLLVEGLVEIGNPQGSGLDTPAQIKLALLGTSIYNALFASPAAEEVIDMYLGYREQFPAERSWVGIYDIGSPVYWWRHRRPAELYQEKMQMIADMTGAWMEIDEKGSISEVSATDDRSAEARAMRQFRGIEGTPVANSRLGGVWVDENGEYQTPSGEIKRITVDDVKKGVEIGGVVLKSSIVQYSDIAAGTIDASVINETAIENKIDVTKSYIERSHIGDAKGEYGFAYNVLAGKTIEVVRIAVADVFRPDIEDDRYEKGQTRVWASFGVDGKRDGNAYLEGEGYKNAYTFNQLREFPNDTNANAIVRDTAEKNLFKMESKQDGGRGGLDTNAININDGSNVWYEIVTAEYHSHIKPADSKRMDGSATVDIMKYVEYISVRGLIRAGPLQQFINAFLPVYDRILRYKKTSLVLFLKNNYAHIDAPFKQSVDLLAQRYPPAIFDYDRTFIDTAGSWVYALDKLLPEYAGMPVDERVFGRLKSVGYDGGRLSELYRKNFLMATMPRGRKQKIVEGAGIGYRKVPQSGINNEHRTGRFETVSWFEYLLSGLPVGIKVEVFVDAAEEFLRCL
jgi:hypothetical protein